MDIFKNVSQSTETYVKDLNNKITADDVKLLLSAIVGAFGYFALGLYGAAAGVAVYCIGTVARVKSALWAVGAASVTYSMGKKDFALVFLLVAAYLYIRT